MADKHSVVEDLEYIEQHTDTLDVLVALAEEASELSKAALKYARALKLVNHPTPVCKEVALENLNEEIVDVEVVLRVAHSKKIIRPTCCFSEKVNRWASRLREAVYHGN